MAALLVLLFASLYLAQCQDQRFQYLGQYPSHYPSGSNSYKENIGQYLNNQFQPRASSSAYGLGGRTIEADYLTDINERIGQHQAYKALLMQRGYRPRPTQGQYGPDPWDQRAEDAYGNKVNPLQQYLNAYGDSLLEERLNNIPSHSHGPGGELIGAPQFEDIDVDEGEPIVEEVVVIEDPNEDDSEEEVLVVEDPNEDDTEEEVLVVEDPMTQYPVVEDPEDPEEIVIVQDPEDPEEEIVIVQVPKEDMMDDDTNEEDLMTDETAEDDNE